MSDEFKSIEAIRKEEMKNKKKNSISPQIIELLKNTLIMLCIALVAGGILGFVYEITKDPIAMRVAEQKKLANQQVFMLASDFSDSMVNSPTLVSGFDGVDITDCLEAYDTEHNLLGYVIEVTSHEGYGGDIVFRIGIELSGNINAISITSISETAGLGMRAPEVLAPQFRNRNELSFEVVKTGSVADNQIDAISSATITSKAVTKGVNAALAYFRESLMGVMNYES